MLKTGKKILCTLLIMIMCLTSAPLQGFVGLDFSSWFASEAEAAGVSTNETYWAMSPSEAKGFIGFLYDTSNVTSEMMNDGNIYNFLTGNLTKGSDEEIKARLYFCMFAASSINQHIDSTGTAISVSSDFLIQYLKDKSGGDIDDGLANSILGDVKDSIKKTLIYSFNVAEETVDNLSLIKTAYDLITDLPGKINQFVQDAQAALSAFILVLSHSKRARYSYVSGRVSNMSCSAYSNPDVAEIMDWYTDFAVHENNAFAGLDFANKWDTVEHKEILDKYAKFIYLANNSSFKSSNDIKTMEVHCPTDVYAYNKLGECVISIIDNKVDYCADGYFAAVKESYKLVVSTFDEELNIKIRGTDNGTMDCSVKSFNEGGMLREIKYDDVYLDENIEYSTLIPEDTFVDKNEYTLVSNNGNLIGADYDSLPPIEENIVDVVVAEELFDGFPIEVIDLVADTMFNMKSVVDLAAYDISTDDAVALFSAVAKYYPAEYSLIANSDFTYKIIVSPNLDRIMKIRFYYGDDANLDIYQKRVNDLNAEIDALVAKVEGMNEFEKALYIHDYIVLNCEYDLELLEILETNGTLTGELRSERYTEYSVLVNGTGICGSYALAYRAILNAAGMECLYLSSSQMNHAWNLVKIDGKWYHVDCCWDDPTPDTYGRARRTYFLRTDDEIMNLNHYSWTPGQYKANSEKYSDMPRNYDIKQKYDDGKWYYLTGSTLYSSDEHGKNETEITSISASSIDADNGNVYYSNGRYIYEYNIETEKTAPVYILSNKDSGDKPSQAYLSNIYVDGENAEFYKSIYSDDKRITAYGTDILQREKFSAITGIEISDSEVSLDVFETLQLSANIITTGSVEDLEIEWSSADNNIAMVDNSGLVTGKNIGSTTIKATFNQFQVFCSVQVTGDGLAGSIYKGTWNYDVQSKTLMISGTADLAYYSGWPVRSMWTSFMYDVENVIIEDGITGISDQIFMDFSNLKNVSFSKTIKYIGRETFSNCKKIETIQFPVNLEEIGDMAFCECSSLREIYISESVQAIGHDTFFLCNAIEKIEVADSNANYSNDDFGVLYDKDKTTLIKYPIASDITSYDIPYGVEVIDFEAFRFSKNLKSVTFPGTVRTISGYAFSDCEFLENVYFDNGLKEISTCAFGECINLKQIDFPSTLKHIGYASFAGTSLENVIIPESVVSIGELCFSRCKYIKNFLVEADNQYYTSANGVLYNKDKTELYCYPSSSASESFDIPEGVNLISHKAFNYAQKLKNINIPESVTTIEGSAFDKCTLLKEIFIPKNVKSVGLTPFNECLSLEFIEVDNENQNFKNDKCGVLYNYVGTELLQYPCGRKDENYIVSDGVIEIKYGAFYKSVWLKNVQIPNTVTKIGWYAFYGCENLYNIVIPRYVTELGMSAFKNCSALEKIVIPENINELWQAFDGCHKLSKILILASSFDSYYIGSEPIEDAIYYCHYNSSVSNFYIKYGYTTENIDDLTNHTEHEYFLFDYCIPTEMRDGYEYWKCYCGESTYTNVLHYYNNSTTTEPTCTADGYRSTFCGNCNDTVVLEITPATGKHNYKLISTLPGTCITAPVYTYTCSSCGDTYTKEGKIEEGHSYETTVVSPTCDERGYTKEMCTVCGETLLSDFTSPKGHEFIINKSADYCSAHGTLEYACKNCDYIESVASDGENLITETVTVEPTCTNSGTKSEICTLCGATVSVEILNPLSHDYSDEWTVDTEPTCTEKGSKSKHCARCDAKREVTAVDEAGHKYYDKWLERIAPTCEKDGLEYRNCYVCNKAEETRIAGKLGHNYASDWSVDVEPTCTAIGSKSHHCTRCNSKLDITEIAKLNHSYKAVVTTPTCTAKGYTTHTCTSCGDTYTDAETAALGHKMSAYMVTKEPTCTDKGTEMSTCTVCTHSETKSVAAKGHNYKDGMCTGCGKSKVENCTHMCHKGGFMGFIWKIVRFFWKLFRMNPICECGVKHY